MASKSDPPNIPKPADSSEADKRRALLRVVLRETLRKSGFPSDWVGAQTRGLVRKDGAAMLEVRFTVLCDEPRLLYYLSAFQAEFERRILAIDPKAAGWLHAMTWTLTTTLGEVAEEFRLPPADYWPHVARDRDIAAKQRGEIKWSQEDLARQFESTDPAPLQEAGDTQPQDL